MYTCPPDSPHLLHALWIVVHKHESSMCVSQSCIIWPKFWLECIHASVHLCMSTWLSMSAPPPLHYYVKKVKYAFDIVYSRLWQFQRHFTSLPQQGTCTTLSKLSPWGDQIRWSLITAHYACPPYVLLVPILHLGMVEQVCDLRRHAQHLH